jgi:DNA-binding transcriptional LysR family regulator
VKPNQLNAFVAVAGQLSIRGAARTLALSQPAVTKIVRELEREVGAPLVERSVKGVTLTPYGRAFLPRAKLLLEDMRRAREEIVQMRDGATGTVAVAVSTAFAMSLLPPAFKAFHERFPAVDVQFSEATLPSMMARLNDGSLDFAVAHAWADSLDRDFDVTELYPIKVALAVRRDHPLRHATSLRDFHAAEWVLPGDAAISMGVAAPMFSSVGLPPPPRVIQVQSANIAFGLMAAMDVVSLFAESQLPWVLKNYGIEAVRIVETLPKASVYMIRRKGQPLTSAAGQLAGCISSEAVNAGLTTSEGLGRTN